MKTPATALPPAAALRSSSAPHSRCTFSAAVLLAASAPAPLRLMLLPLVPPIPRATLAPLAVALFLLALLPAGALGQAASSFTIDHAIDVTGVSDPQLSPDGTRLIYARSELDWEENERRTRLWLVNADGSDPRPYTAEEGDSRARWSPDGRWISFLRSTGESPRRTRQLFLLRTDGGEARQLTRHATSISQYEWLPGSDGIVFLAADSLSRDEREARRKGHDAVFVDEGPSGQRRGEWMNLWQVALDLDSARARPVTEGERRVGGFAIAPDGRRVAFTFRTENHRNDGFRSEIALVDLPALRPDGASAGADSDGGGSDGGRSDGGGSDGRSIRQLTHNEAPESQLAWSPDGRTLTFVAPHLETWELAQGNLYAMDVASGESRRLAAGFQGDLRGYEWAPDGRSIDMIALERTDANLYRLDVRTDRVRRMSDLGGVAGNASWSRDHSRVAFTLATPTSPTDIHVSAFPTVSPVAVTDANPALSALALADPEIVRWNSADGLEIEGLLYRPNGGAASGPLVLEIHGGPAGVFTRGFNAGAQIMAAHGYAVLQPNVRGSSGYGDALLRGNMRDIGGGDFDDVITGVESMIARGVAHPDSLAVKGWSYGGILGGWTITQTDRFKAASLGAMVADWRSEFGAGFNFDVVRWYLGGDPWSNREFWIERSPYTHADRVRTPTILFHGDEDTTDTVEQTLNFHAGLRYHGVPTRTLRFPRAGHGLSEPRHQRIRFVEELRWFQQHVRGDVDWQAPERPTEAPVVADDEEDEEAEEEDRRERSSA